MIVFDTPTELDIAAITTFGLSAKDCDSPIGRFGTGLKYALAVLIREGAEVTILSGMRTLKIAAEERAFRGDSYLAIVAEPAHEPRFDLPFTSQLGRDWELWQAFRELYSNTIDEGGKAYRITRPDPAKDSKTQIVIAHAEFEAIFDDREQIIIEDKPIWENDELAIFEGESKYTFYRNIRARELKHPAAFRYSIKSETDLTEDRTIKYDWEADDVIMKALAQCDDEEILKRALGQERESHEGKFNWLDTTPGEAFSRAVTEVQSTKKDARLGTAVAAIAKPVNTVSRKIMTLRTKTICNCGQPIEPHRVGKQGNCLACHAAYMRAHRPKYSDMTPEQKRRDSARSYARVLLQRGKIEKGPCEDCGSTDVIIYLEDYNKPRDVTWLCRSHSRHRKAARRRTIDGAT